MGLAHLTTLATPTRHGECTVNVCAVHCAVHCKAPHSGARLPLQLCDCAPHLITCDHLQCHAGGLHEHAFTCGRTSLTMRAHLITCASRLHVHLTCTPSRAPHHASCTPRRHLTCAPNTCTIATRLHASLAPSASAKHVFMMPTFGPPLRASQGLSQGLLLALAFDETLAIIGH